MQLGKGRGVDSLVFFANCSVLGGSIEEVTERYITLFFRHKKVDEKSYRIHLRTKDSFVTFSENGRILIRNRSICK